MSRGPLDVLREAVYEGRFERDRVDPRGAAEWKAEGHEAIAQVEALAEVANRISLARIAFVDRGVAMKGALFAELNAKLQPFTPGQDSEGGHGR